MITKENSAWKVFFEIITEESTDTEVIQRVYNIVLDSDYLDIDDCIDSILKKYRVWTIFETESQGVEYVKQVLVKSV